MKRFLSVCFLVVLSILLTPIFSDNYSAIAGRAGMGNLASSECECGAPGPPCYDQYTWQLCNPEDGYLRESQPTDSKSTNDTIPVDGTSFGLMIFVGAYLFRRFIL